MRTRRPSPEAARRRSAVAALTVAVVLGGAGAAAAHDWVPIFRTEQVSPISFRAADLLALPDLGAYGELTMRGDADVRQVADATAAAAATGLDVPEVRTLPRGVRGAPTYQVGGPVRATFTFATHRAARTGGALPAPPPGLDGSQVRFEAGPGVAAVWSQAAGVPELLVARAVAPRASASGVTFEVMREYLLSLPGLPDEVAAQLRAFAGDGSTLPLPVPADLVTSSSAQVNGVPATVLATRDRTLAAAVWVDDGVVTVVAGTLDAGEVLSIARELR